MLRFTLAIIAVATLLLSLVAGVTETDSTAGHVYSSGNWQSLTATPGALKSSAMVYSPDDEKIVMYGGLRASGSFFNELWVYDIASATWTQKNCVSSCPAGRAVHSMAYDDNKNLFIVFGGYLTSGHSFETNETWTYNLATNTWTKLDFGSQDIPARRHWGSLEYNPDQKVTYLFGGHYNNQGCPGDIMYNDVWKLDIRGATPTWTKLNPASDPTFGKPAPRQSDWIYNTAENKFYVLGGKQELGPAPGTPCGSGGSNRETFYNDIWSYDPVANEWKRIQANQKDYTHYPKERRTKMVYDAPYNRVIFFSGVSQAKDTWIYDFDDDKWSTVQDTDYIIPRVRMASAAAWDPANNVMYMYGGISGGTILGDFWKLKIVKNNISISCFNTQPVIFGTYSNDPSLLGNSQVNVIAGLSGDDTIRGEQGNDFLCGGPDDDKIFGSDGNDKLFSFDGNDEINGGAGNDLLRGGAGNDKLIGEIGKDTFECGGGTDTIVDFNTSEGDTKTADCENF
jgi:N-acetylneuraminic acid mutarotase